jgi:hypothetical protein
VIDSTSGKDGKIISGGPRGHTEFTLLSDNTFIVKWSDGDVMGEHTGVCRFENTQNTIQPMLVFSVYSFQKKDSVVRRDSMTILKLTDSILKTEERESYTTLDSILIIQNRINIYKKRNNRK